ncbi:IS3 family transposase [Demequina capsici]|uniref:IS3 family transposase n=1 Tax=Demequina capsici TaxID=3075620 RepID=A0AA96F5U2_9MICO|nr:IS3 family transposase [Demequina sp. OYTSA14]WNM23305.1 IS3 family transposase [Demequina sp. OYTSA14]
MIAAEGLPVQVACRVLAVSEAGLYEARKRAPSERSIRHAMLTDLIADIHQDCHGIYGARRVHAELTIGRGIAVGHGQVELLMKRAGLQGVSGRRKWRRSKPDTIATDLVERDFTRSGPNQLWVTDITEHPTREGKVYCCVVLDAYSRRVVGWSIDASPTAALVTNALGMAIDTRLGRSGGAGTIIHSDRGVQGGFNWSSQHLEWEVCDGASSAGCGSGDQAEVEVAGSSEVPASRRGRVLGADREGSARGGSRGGRRRGAGGRCSVVPQGWRHAAIRHQAAAFGQVSVLR